MNSQLNNTKFDLSSDFDFLIISPKNFISPIIKLSNHKTNHEINTKIVALEQIYDNHFLSLKANDHAEKIKFFIKKIYEKCNVKYVLLVGGIKQLPTRTVHNPAKDDFMDFYESTLISDLYYADLLNDDGTFSTWDTNKNGIYGEWTGKTAEDKNIDLKPDICVGRIPCLNKIETIIMVNKIISYENKPQDNKYFNKIVSVGGDTYLNNDGIFEGEVDLENTLKNMENFNHVKLFSSTGQLKSKNGYEIVKKINQGCGFLVLAGHGNPFFWSTFKPNDRKKIGKFTTNQMALLNNGKKLPICITCGCRNSNFDTSITNFFKNPKKSWNRSFDFLPKCWSWALTNKIGGGSIATVGSTCLSYTKWDKETDGRADAWSYIMPRFFYEYNKNNVDSLGQIWKNVIISYLKKFPIDWDTPSICYDSPDTKHGAINARTVQGLVLFGDPTLKIGGYK